VLGGDRVQLVAQLEITPMTCIHVLPIHDLQAHDLSTQCPCVPRTEREDDGEIVVHNAFDFREVMERAGMHDPDGPWTVEVDDGR
jgi:hypothetical protein